MGFSFNPTKPFSYLPDSTKQYIPGIGDAMAADDANKMNAQHAKNQMNFQEKMSNTSYQRAMEDMKKAGLNPMLAFSQGGASTPAGASATASPATKTKLAELGASAAMGGIPSMANMRTQQALAENTIQDSVQNRQIQTTQSAKNLAEMENTRVDTAIKRRELPSARMKEKAYSGAEKVINRLIENFSSSAKENKNHQPLIKPQGPASKEEGSKMFKWLTNKKG